VDRGCLVAFHEDDALTLSSPRVPFVSHPYEWSNAQFLDAARLTLEISEAVLEEGYELKDASAWNVIFAGTRPVFCDLLSFERVEGARWWAFAQYMRHFVFPLCAARYRKLNASQTFAMYRDGLPGEVLKGLLGWRRFLTRFWPLLLSVGAKGGEGAGKKASRGSSYHKGLYGHIRWLLGGLHGGLRQSSHWASYTSTRGHYTEASSAQKYELVSRWLRDAAPERVIDIGCNTGEFSLLAAETATTVVAVDLDHECVQNLYLNAKSGKIYPVLATLDDLSGGRGWGGCEFPGLAKRLEGFGDVVLMLAVIHHLAITSAVSFDRIAAFAASITKGYLVVEMLEHTDPLVGKLAKQTNRRPEEFAMEFQTAAFASHFETVEAAKLTGTDRHLLLMKKR